VTALAGPAHRHRLGTDRRLVALARDRSELGAFIDQLLCSGRKFLGLFPDGRQRLGVIAVSDAGACREVILDFARTGVDVGGAGRNQREIGRFLLQLAAHGLEGIADGFEIVVPFLQHRWFIGSSGCVAGSFARTGGQPDSKCGDECGHHNGARGCFASHRETPLSGILVDPDRQARSLCATSQMIADLQIFKSANYLLACD
jgi:hypothetical protein